MAAAKLVGVALWLVTCDLLGPGTPLLARERE